MKAVHSLVGMGKAVTYKSAAENLGIGVGTLYTYLKRVRRNHPEIYQTIMGVRKAQLAQRHEEALAKADEHNHMWHRARGKAYNRLMCMI